MKKRGALAISQIFLLMISVVAISYAIGSEVKIVSGAFHYVDNTFTLEENVQKAIENGFVSSSKNARWTYDGVKKDFYIKGYPNWRMSENKAKSVIQNILDGVVDIPNSNWATDAEMKSASLPLPSEASHGWGGKIVDFIGGEGASAPAGIYRGIGPTGEAYVFPRTGSGYSISGIIQGAGHAIAIWGFIKTVGSLFGADERTVDAIARSAAGGYFVGKGIYSSIGKGGYFDLHGKLWGKFTAKQLSLGGGVIVAAIIFYATYKKESQKVVTYQCYPWEAPVGGEHCEKCNKQGDLPCSEYQCRSLGQACELLNPGTEEEKCVWVNRHDVKYPEITPWDHALLDGYKYKPHKTVSPPDRGAIVWNQESKTGCAKAFTPLSFGITTDEPAKCRLDYLRKPGFDEMSFYFGGSSLFKYNHTQVMSLPGASNLESENLTIKNNGEFEVYVRCQDANGNHNTANFVFKYCVEQGPDTTPPLIVTTNLLNNMPIAYNQSSVDIEVYINEPADCKWSHLDKSYNDMEEDMVCSSSILEMNAQMLYKCSTTLTGLKNRQKNKFYFRCKDQPIGVKDEDRNVNTESYEFTLIGTQPLIIDFVKPNETIKDSTETVKVTLEAQTSAGYNEGEATCYYSNTGDDYIMFFYESGTDNLNYKHSQELWLPEGEYEYFIKCIDLGGNSDIKITNFRVDSDSEAPIVVRAYREETYLKLITNEPAECVYDTVDCSYLFDDGIKMTAVDDTSHFTDWNTNIDLYVKCQDKYGNQPMPNKCSIIVRAFEVYKEE